MKKIYLLLALLGVVATITIFGCDQKEDVTNSINKEGSVTVVLSTSHLNDSFDLVTTKIEVYKANVKVRDYVTIDTVPSLGKIKTEAEDNDGNTKEVIVPKEYEFFVTLK